MAIQRFVDEHGLPESKQRPPLQIAVQPTHEVGPQPARLTFEGQPVG
jgi:hypothetical protein